MQPINHRGNGHSVLTADAHGPALTFQDLHELTADELERLALEERIDLSAPRHQQRISERQAAARKYAPIEPGRTQRFTVAVGNFVLMLIMLSIRNIVMPFSIVGLAYAEHLRVKAGIEQFDSGNAGVLSFVAIGLYLGLLVVYAHTVDTSTITGYQWSVRLWWKNMRYTLGWGDKDNPWRARRQNSVDTLMSAVGSVGMLIIFLGTYGSLHTELAAATKALKPGDTLAWYDGIWKIMSGASLDAFMAIVGGLILTWALLRGLKWVVGYNYNHFRQLVPVSVDFLSASSDTSELEAEARRQYILHQIIEARKQRQQPQT